MPQFAIKDIEPNPFRHMERYPIRRKTVAALRESLKTTGFWGNIVARALNGKAEIAYGHHRLIALKEEYGPNHKVALLIQDLSDNTMLKIMARENMDEWGTSAPVEHETIRAVVEAYEEGKITLPAVPKNAKASQIRYAPSFELGKPDDPRAPADHPYTAQTLAEFIGWVQPNGEPQDKVYSSLTALQFIQEGLLAESDFDDLTTTQANAVISEARKARDRREAAARAHRLQAKQAKREAEEAARRQKEAEHELRRQEAVVAKARDEETRRRAREQAERSKREQREAEEARRRAQKRQAAAERHAEKQRQEGRQSATVIGRAVSKKLKEGKIGYRQAGDVARKLEGKKAGPPPGIEGFARRLMTDVNKILDPEYDQRAARLGEIIRYREYLSDVIRKDAASTLRQVANRCLDYASELWPEGQPTASKSAQRRLPRR